MKFPKLFAFSLLALASAGITRADWVIEQKNDSPAGQGKTVMKIKGDKVLTNVDGGPTGPMTVIMDTKSGEVTSIMHGQKMVMKQSGANMKAMMEQLGKGKAEAAKPVDTGAKEKVGDYDCNIYTAEIAGVKTKMWVANNYPNGDKLVEVQNKIAATMPGGKDMAVKGIAVKTEAEVPALPGMAAQKITTTLVSAKEEAVPDSEFAVPKDYKEMTMPVMPTAPAAPKAQ